MKIKNIPELLNQVRRELPMHFGGNPLMGAGYYGGGIVVTVKWSYTPFSDDGVMLTAIVKKKKLLKWSRSKLKAKLVNAFSSLKIIA